MADTLCIHHHLGLGDHFDMNGMVRQFLNTPFDYSDIIVFSKSNYYSMVEYMYRDDDRIHVIEIDKDKDEDTQVRNYLEEHKPTKFLRIGFENYPFLQENQYDKNCWEFFYEQISFDKKIRTDSFYCQRHLEEEKRVFDKLNPEGKPFVFLHDDPERGFEIDRTKIDTDLLVIENDTSENIFYFLMLLEKAEEIHCMESSFKSLIDLYAGTDKIYYHDFRNQPLGNYTNKKWEVIKYD